MIYARLQEQPLHLLFGVLQIFETLNRIEPETVMRGSQNSPLNSHVLLGKA
jgi:hypothetical protein